MTQCRRCKGFNLTFFVLDGDLVCVNCYRMAFPNFRG